MAQIPDALRQALKSLSAGQPVPARPLVLGVAGGVAAGKSTFAEALRADLTAELGVQHIEIVATDGFLFPNRILAERDLSMRKGFPESYDFAALVEALVMLRKGDVAHVPLYSHVAYDVDSSNRREIGNAQIVILDGLHLGRAKFGTDGSRLIDRLIYLDADEDDIRSWFADRLRPLMIEGRTDPNSFYFGFREMDDTAVEQFIQRVWVNINLPNLREYIVKDRDAADIVVRKSRDHSVTDVVVKSKD
jgi:type I pantothenate kinase